MIFGIFGKFGIEIGDPKKFGRKKIVEKNQKILEFERVRVERVIGTRSLFGTISYTSDKDCKYDLASRCVTVVTL